MPKFFCISDIHSFYDPMLDALSDAGYDPSNPEHWLVDKEEKKEYVYRHPF